MHLGRGATLLDHELGSTRSVDRGRNALLRLLYYSTGTTGLIVGRLPATAWLLIYSVVLVVVISAPLSILAATRKNGMRDHLVRIVPLFGLGMPSFWVGIILAELFAIKVHLFPVDGFGTGFFGHLHYMFLPSLTVALAMAPVVIRSLRSSMLDILGTDFIVTARSKGVPGPRLFMRHVLRNAVLPTVTVLGVNIGFLIGSTVIIEQVFALPGIGSLMVNAIFNRDFPVVQGVTLVFGVLVIGVNLLTDVAYSALDPRVKLGR